MPAKLLSSHTAYSGRRISVTIDRVLLGNGENRELSLEMVRHPGASAVVPVIQAGDDPLVLLIRQYRWAANGVIWEIPAGTLEPDESPEGCARRELAEEAGVQADTMDRLTTIWTTPGFTDEVIHLFVASGLHPVASAHQADEVIETATRPMSQVLAMIRDGEIRDGKTMVALLYVAGFRFGL